MVNVNIESGVQMEIQGIYKFLMYDSSQIELSCIDYDVETVILIVKAIILSKRFCEWALSLGQQKYCVKQIILWLYSGY